MKLNPELRYTPHALNFAFGVIGLTIVWSSTHNWLAILGAFIAAIHVSVRVK